MEYFIGWIFFCVVAGMYAHFHRNRSGIGWFFVGFFFTPLVALILLLVLPALTAEQRALANANSLFERERLEREFAKKGRDPRWDNLRSTP